jgi:protein-disulfide isomerase
MTRRRGQSLLGVVVDIATLGALVLLVAVRWRGNNGSAAVRATAVERTLPDSLWSLAWQTAHVLGDRDAPVKVLQFSDLECPACRRFASETRGLTGDRHGTVAMGFVHHPLSQHRFARRAAMVAECAATCGQFWAAYDSLLARQSDFGLVAWSSVLGNGMTDGDIERCLEEAAGTDVLAAHAALADAVDVAGTPTVVVNGVVLPMTPTRLQLDSIIDATLRSAAR